MCDALGINGKTSGQALPGGHRIQVDESREITVQFVATNNEGMPWEFRPSHHHDEGEPGRRERDGTLRATRCPRHGRPGDTQRVARPGRRSTSTRPSVSASTSSRLDGKEHRDAAAVHRRPGPAQNIKTITLSYTIFDITEMASWRSRVALTGKISMATQMATAHNEYYVPEKSGMAISATIGLVLSILGAANPQ